MSNNGSGKIILGALNGEVICFDHSFFSLKTSYPLCGTLKLLSLQWGGEEYILCQDSN